MSDKDNHDQNHLNDVDYERSDVKVVGIGVAIAVGLLLVAAALVAVDQFFILSEEKMKYEVALKPQSKLLRDIRAREDQILTSYGVVDSTKGTYRIPIEQAMQMMAQETYRHQTSTEK